MDDEGEMTLVGPPAGGKKEGADDEEENEKKKKKQKPEVGGTLLSMCRSGRVLTDAVLSGLEPLLARHGRELKNSLHQFIGDNTDLLQRVDWDMMSPMIVSDNPLFKALLETHISSIIEALKDELSGGDTNGWQKERRKLLKRHKKNWSGGPFGRGTMTTMMTMTKKKKKK